MFAAARQPHMRTARHNMPALSSLGRELAADPLTRPSCPQERIHHFTTPPPRWPPRHRHEVRQVLVIASRSPVTVRDIANC